MMTDVLPSGMSLVVLRALRKIEIDIPESMKMMILIVQRTMQTISLMHSTTPVFFRRRDVDFIYELAENTTRLILDKNLNKESLTEQVMK
jgi:hypothetical protein